MDIEFRTKRLQETCNDKKKRDREYGPERSKILLRRLVQMSNAATLEEFKQVHPRAHSLRADRKGEWAADLDHPYRLIFEPVPDPVDEDEGDTGSADEATAISAIRVVKILEVGVDYHG